MRKESLPTNLLSTDQLIQQRDKTLQMIEKRQYHIGLIGQCKIKDGSSFENSLELGRRRDYAKNLLEQDQQKLNDTNQELSAYNQAKQYLEEIRLRQTQLDEMSQMVAQGNIFPQIFEKHQNEFQELTLLPETDPVLARGIARIRIEEERKKQTQESTPTSDKKLSGKSAQLLSLLEENPDDLVTSDQLTQCLWPGIDNNTARKRLSVLVSTTKRKLLDKGLNLDIGVLDSCTKRCGGKAQYYLIKNDQSSQVPEPTQPDETPKNTDSIVADKPQTSKEEEIDAINKPEFGTLSRVDIYLIASTIHYNSNLESILKSYNLGLIDEQTATGLSNIIGEICLADSKKMTKEQYLDSRGKFITEALQKAKDLIESPEADKILDQIYGQNSDVWCLLANLSEMNDNLEGEVKGGNKNCVTKRGIDFLKYLFTNPESKEFVIYVTNKQGEKFPHIIKPKNYYYNSRCVVSTDNERWDFD